MCRGDLLGGGRVLGEVRDRGREDEALERLRRAVELDPRTRGWAADDDDLAPIRERL